ncbi:MAG TPA: BlaI/MecI/CopY family transcriptional regulator [Bryobacteraceae bacterium]|jgi:predicted transcriptional regulator|nr:BlaI/MecI/CopY family transcriptional regulator [Bryobacteraceae bacterium]
MATKLPLSGLEQEVMDVVWSAGKVTAADVQAALAPGRVLRDSTVRTVLSRLEDKGYLRHEVEGRTFIYSSLERPRRLAVRAVKQIIDRFCHGSVESLLTGMVDDEVVDAKELQRIIDRLAAKRKESPK